MMTTIGQMATCIPYLPFIPALQLSLLYSLLIWESKLISAVKCCSHNATQGVALALSLIGVG